MRMSGVNLQEELSACLSVYLGVGCRNAWNDLICDVVVREVFQIMVERAPRKMSAFSFDNCSYTRGPFYSEIDSAPVFQLFSGYRSSAWY